jgi:hypothetical protein
MKRIILFCFSISVLCAAYPAKADILSWFKPKSAPVVQPRPADPIVSEDVIWAEKQAAEKARFEAWRKEHPEPAGPPKPPGHWCLIGHLSGHPGLTPIICQIDSEADCLAKWQPKYKGSVCQK